MLRSSSDGSRSTTFSYDGGGAMAAQQQAGGTVVTTSYAYQDSGLPSSLNSSTFGGTVAWSYDAGGQPSSESRPNGQTTSFAFNGDGTLASQSLTGGGQTLASWGYSYDGNYHQTQQTFSGAAAAPGPAVSYTFGYGYDNANRLHSFTETASGVSVFSSTVNYDQNGNRTSYNSQSWTYNPDDSIASQTNALGVASNYSYDAAGRLLSDGTNNYCYDGFDRLHAVGNSTSSCSGSSPVASYSYDGLDRQATQTEAGATTTYHYSGLSQQPATESKSGGDTSIEIAPKGRPLTINVPSVGVQNLFDDAHGNVSTVTTIAGGTPVVACTVRYDPFGSPIAQGGQPSTSANPCNTGSTPNDFFYRAGRQDMTTGNYQFGSRTYDPTKAAFLTPDSYRTGGSGANLSVGTDPLTADRYSYVNGDPVNLVDPSGHMLLCGDPEDACYYTQRHQRSAPALQSASSDCAPGTPCPEPSYAHIQALLASIDVVDSGQADDPYLCSDALGYCILQSSLEAAAKASDVGSAYYSYKFQAVSGYTRASGVVVNGYLRHAAGTVAKGDLIGRFGIGVSVLATAIDDYQSEGERNPHMSQTERLGRALAFGAVVGGTAAAGAGLVGGFAGDGAAAFCAGTLETGPEVTALCAGGVAIISAALTDAALTSLETYGYQASFDPDTNTFSVNAALPPYNGPTPQPTPGPE